MSTFTNQLVIVKKKGELRVVCLFARRFIRKSRICPLPIFESCCLCIASIFRLIFPRFHRALVCTHTGSDGMAVPLTQNDDVLFGREESANIRIQKSSVSAQHTKIFWDAAGMVRRHPRFLCTRSVCVVCMFALRGSNNALCAGRVCFRMHRFVNSNGSFFVFGVCRVIRLVPFGSCFEIVE